MNNQDYLKQLGSKIRAARRAKGISLEKMAELCMTDYSNLSAVECGKKNTHILTLKNIADVLKIEMKELI